MNVFNWIFFTTILISSIGMILSNDRRWMIAFLATQYLGVAWLVHTHWSLSMSAVKLVTGWMVCIILGLTLLQSRDFQEMNEYPKGKLFLVMTNLLAMVVSFGLATKAAEWLTITLPIAWGGLFLITIGLIVLGMSNEPFRVMLGLLIALSGFEILYSTVESSSLVTGSLSVINIGLALTCAYIIHSENNGEFS